MQVTPLVWMLTLGLILATLLLDLAVVSRRPHRPSARESARWVLLYIGLAILFGLAVGAVSGRQYGGEFFAGWLTEYSLSLDNLFVFLLIMTRFRVPEAIQRTVLVVGILLALVLRGLFIAVGAALIARFEWVYYVFGAFLMWTAITLARQGEEPDEFTENAVLRLVRRLVPTTREYDGVRLRTRIDGRPIFTPMLMVMVAIGTTDLLFALDSIPAIFGLTKEPYLVFAANAFALMGLTQVYFLLGGLLDRLVFLGYGLAVILGFIGLKLVFEAMRVNAVPFINGGEPMAWAPEISIALSLGVIAAILAVTATASLLHTRRTVT